MIYSLPVIGLSIIVHILNTWIGHIRLLLAVATTLAQASTRQICFETLVPPSTALFTSALDQLIADVFCLRKDDPTR